MSENLGALTEVGSLKDTAPIASSCLDAMRERRGEVVCFTPALLVTHGYLPVDPAVEFASRFSATADKQPFCVELPVSRAPFFTGLGVSVIAGQRIDWDRRIYGIAAERAKECFDFLGGIGIRSGDSFASSVVYTLNIPDPTTRIFTTNNATIPAHVFGLLRDNTITYLAPNGYDPPYVVTEPANRHMGTFKLNTVTADDVKKLCGDK